MVGTILLILTEGYDDMAYLSSQVILEEAGNDVISASPQGGALKGETSSVMTVTIEEALSQEINYIALVIVGGSKLATIPNLSTIVSQFNTDGKVIAAFDTGISALQSAGITDGLSNDAQLIKSDNILTMKTPQDCESFAETLAGMLV